jgi:hypothetical protein
MVDSLLKSDIFFFIASLATVVLVILISILLFYLIKTGKNLYKLSEILKKKVAEGEEFILEMKESLKNNLISKLFLLFIKNSKKIKK